MIRIILGQIALVAGLCMNIPVSEEDTVHEIRKGIKRIRSVNRMLRYSLGEERFRAENKRYSEISMPLADLRRSDVLLTAVTPVLEKLNKDLSPPTVHNLTRLFSKRKAVLYRSLARDENVFSHCLKKLSEAREALLENPPAGITQESILKGYGQTYRSGRLRLKKALEVPSTENNHELRKAVKNLWNQTQVLCMLWPPVLNSYIHSLDRLGDALGTDHDLAELEDAIGNRPVIETRDLQKVLKELERRRSKYQRSAWQMAGKIYAETPAAFVKRMKAYF